MIAGPHASSWTLRLLALLACVLLVGGCTGSSTGSNEPGLTSGPLKIMSYAGELSANKPPSAGNSWTETFGGVILCTTAPVLIGSVRYSGPTEPIHSYATLHWITEQKQPTSTSVLSMRGGPERNATNWRALGGRFERVTEADILVKPNCEERRKLELLTTVRAAKRGADITTIVVEYSFEGADYSLQVPYRYVACGVAIGNPNRYCTNTKPAG